MLLGSPVSYLRGPVGTLTGLSERFATIQIGKCRLTVKREHVRQRQRAKMSREEKNRRRRETRKLLKEWEALCH